MDPEKLAELKARVRNHFAERKRQEALHPPIRPYVNEEEVDAIIELLDATARAPDEGS